VAVIPTHLRNIADPVFVVNKDGSGKGDYSQAEHKLVAQARSDKAPKYRAACHPYINGRPIRGVSCALSSRGSAADGNN